MAASATSQFGVVLLFSIGTLLLLTMAPQFGTALECQYVNVPEYGGRPAAAWQLNKLINFATANDGAFGVPANGGNRTVKCPTSYNNCISLHCQKYFGDITVKGCAKLSARTITPEAACDYLRDIVCRDDPKFYCRFCQTDKCNNE